MTLLMNIVSWMMDESIHCPKPYRLLSPTWDEILSWVVETWMKNHLVSDGIVIYNTYFILFYKEWLNNVGLTFSVDDTISWLTISFEPTKRLELVTLNIILSVVTNKRLNLRSNRFNFKTSRKLPVTLENL